MICMHLARVAAIALLFVHVVVAFSQARNPLQYLEILDSARIRSPKGRVHAYSHFDVEFDLRSRQQSVRLSLEPNHDVIGDGATISYVGSDGSVVHSEVIDRLEHKVFKGAAQVLNADDTWSNAGWARITVLRDGVRPLLEGAFSINHDNHHIQMSSSYMRTKHASDPHLEEEDDEFMVLFRDSDVQQSQSVLRRSLSGSQCSSHELEFNSRSDHPVYTGLLTKDAGKWGTMSLSSMFGKRQIDTQSSGNQAGVNLTNTIGQSVGCPTTRRVALVGVATDCGYTGTFNSTQTARQNVIQVMNAASSVYESAFNISLGLQNLTIMSADCPGTSQAATPWNRDCGSSLDITDRLNLFSGWRGTLQDTNSHWTLMTSCNTGDTVGLAWLGQACVHNAQTANTTGGGSETVSGANVVALTSTEWQVVAHETGHTFGAVHDCTSQTCSDGTSVNTQQCCPHAAGTCSETDTLYIMNPYTTSGITAFSACSIGNICSAMGRNSVNTTCLSTNKNIPTISGAQCGNGIVEEGEDCDCGGTAGCADDPCCNPTTCKFLNGAVCDDANDDCCTQCQFSTNGTLCRSSSGICDPAEYCTGSSGTCPANVVAPDGQHCTLTNSTDKNLACASGQCTSRDLQCHNVMSGYLTSANTTFACDDSNCYMSCASPAFGPGVCYSLQQNLLDGTPCGGDGQCSNGVCRGATVGGQIRSWIDDHKAVVIGVAVGVGILLLLTLFSCCAACIRRSKASRGKAPPVNGRLHRSPPMQENAWPQQQYQQGWGAPPPPQARGQQQVTQSTQPHSYYEPSPGSPPPPPPPQHQWHPQTPQNVLYGAGIIGSRGSAPDNGMSAARSPPPYPMHPPPGYDSGHTGATRYA